MLKFKSINTQDYKQTHETFIIFELYRKIREITDFQHGFNCT